MFVAQSHTSKSAKAALFEARSMDQIVGVLNTHLALQLVTPTGGVDRIVYRHDLNLIEDPKRKERALKGERRQMRKLEDRKRQREEKEHDAGVDHADAGGKANTALQ